MRQHLVKHLQRVGDPLNLFLNCGDTVTTPRGGDICSSRRPKQQQTVRRRNQKHHVNHMTVRKHLIFRDTTARTGQSGARGSWTSKTLRTDVPASKRWVSDVICECDWAFNSKAFHVYVTVCLSNGMGSVASTSSHEPHNYCSGLHASVVDRIAHSWNRMYGPTISCKIPATMEPPTNHPKSHTLAPLTFQKLRVP